MFDLSLAEILVIIVVAVVFIGPKELPTVVRAFAKAMSALRSFSREVRKTMDDIAEESGLKPEIKMIQGDDGKWYESYQSFIPSEVEGSASNAKDPSTRETLAQDKEK